MKQIFISIFFLFWAMSFASAHEGNHNDEVRYVKELNAKPNALKQQQLKNSKGWSMFDAKHSGWWVQFNEASGKPHRAFGNPIQINVSADQVTNALYFLKNELSGYNFPTTDLKLTNISITKSIYIDFHQLYKGLEVINSRATVRMGLDGGIFMFGTDLFTNINLDINPTISHETAAIEAVEGLHGKVVGMMQAPILKVLAIQGNESYTYKLVWEYLIETEDHNQPGQYLTYVDAHTNELIGRQNKVVNYTPQVRGTVNLQNPYATPATSLVGLPHLQATYGTTTVFADSLGNFNFPFSTPTAVNFNLRGRWSRVVTGNTGNVTPTFSQTVNENSTNFNFDGQGTGTDVATIRHLSAYYHTNIVHDYMKSLLPNFTALDIPLLTRVDRNDGNCNAFFNGNSINFYLPGSGCNSLAQVNDVVYHEYGHALTNYFYNSLGQNFSNGAVGEGYSDVLALGITNGLILGIGFSSTSAAQVVRRYDTNPKIYPQNLVGQVHSDGEIICGAWMRTGANIGNRQTMMNIWAESMYGLANGPNGTEGQVYTDILIDALIADDDDNNLTNGTPNINAIVNAFAFHGITLLSSASISHTQINSAQANSLIPINATVNINSSWLPFLNDVKLFYKINNANSYSNVNMTLQSGTTYQGLIPAQPQGTLVSYYMALSDTGGNLSNTAPIEVLGTPANIPYFLVIGSGRAVIEDFDNTFNIDWQFGLPTDNAATGIWTVDVPIPSYIDPTDPGTIVQPGQNFTANGANCAITQNAPAANSPAGTADVDDGVTTLQSPMFSLAGLTNPIVSYMRWYSNEMGATPREDYWQVRISQNGTSWTTLERTNVPDRSWRRYAFRVHDYFPNATQIMVRFLAVDSLQGSLVEAAVDEFEIFDQTIVSVESQSIGNQVNVFPNPANTLVNVEFDLLKAESITLNLYDATGKLVKANNLGLQPSGKFLVPMDLNGIAPGIYMLEIKTPTQSTTQKISKLP